MTRYLNEKFNSKASTDAYRDGWEHTFRDKEDLEDALECPQCGEIAKYADGDGLFHAGSALDCDCIGSIEMSYDNIPFVNFDHIT